MLRPLRSLVLALFVLLPNLRAMDASPAVDEYSGKIAYLGINTHIYHFNADGSGWRELPLIVNKQIFDITASPDGQRVAYVLDDQVYVMNADGSERIQLTEDGAQMHPRWSPNGQYFAFLSTRDGDWELYRMNADGSHQVPLTENLDVRWAEWLPDGQHLLFVRSQLDADNFPQNTVYVTNIDGSERKSLNDKSPAGYSLPTLEHGREVFVNFAFSAINLINLADTNYIEPFAETEVLSEQFSVSPDSSHIAVIRFGTLY